VKGISKAVILVAGLALIAAAALLGCGGDDDGGRPNQASASADTEQTGEGESDRDSEGGGQDSGAGNGEADPTAPRFIREVDAKCQRIRERGTGEFLAFASKQGGASGLSEADRAYIGREIFIPVLETHLDLLRELDPPDGQKADIEEVIGALEGRIERHKRDPAGMMRGAIPPFAEDAMEVALANDFHSCGFE
jgi:hypothetical protein